MFRFSAPAFRAKSRGVGANSTRARRPRSFVRRARLDDLPHFPESGASDSVAFEAPASADLAPFSSLVPAIIGACLMMQTLSATVIVNALPTMARSLHEDPVRLNTAITVYLLAAGIVLPISGWAADRDAVFYLHDYYPLCPRVTLIDAANHFCDIAATDVCARCVAAGGAQGVVQAVEARRDH